MQNINTMPLSPELVAAYALSKRPYIEADGPIPASVLDTKSWRYVLEINSACNLKCSLCHAGNREGYEYEPGIMDMDLLGKILDKIKSENPSAIVCGYCNSEPFLHPHLPECVTAIKSRGLRCEVSSNLNHLNRLEDFLKAAPDLFIVSVSGFTQSTYEKTHIGGDIQKVKDNLHRLKDACNRWNGSVQIAVSYHMYNDNLEEMQQMEDFVKPLGFQFMISWARTISLENTIQSLREIERKHGKTVPLYRIATDGLDLNKALPASKIQYEKAMDRLRFHPIKARQLYKRFPIPSVCIIADVFTLIRCDGSVQHCCWTDDRRLTMGKYLDMTQDQMSEARRGHPLCDECQRFRLNLFYHVVDCNKWDGMNNVQTP